MRARSGLLPAVWAAAVVLGAAGGALARDDGGAAWAGDRLGAANDAYERAVALAESDPEASSAALARAASGYRGVLAGAGTGELPGVRYNLGLALLRSGETGRAIVELRRAERAMRGDPRVERALRVAKRRVGTRFDADEGESLVGSLFGWHELVPVGVRLGLAAGVLGVGWLLAGWRVVCWGWGGGTRPGWAVIVGVLAAGLLPMASLAVEWWSSRGVTSAVVVEDGVTARQGPDAAGYRPAFESALDAGVEVTVLERRPGWVRVSFADGRTAWLPEGAVEEV